MNIGLLFLAMAVGTINSPALFADDRDDLSDHVLEWVKEGKVLSIDVLMERYPTLRNGRLLDLEVEQEHGRIIYELEILRPDAVVYEIKIDGQTGEWLKEEIEE